MLHAPSLAIGAAAASAVLAGALLAAGVVGQAPVYTIEQAPRAPEPTAVSDATYLANGSPFLGDPGAPVTIVEFGDYQCQACNRFFHQTEEELVRRFIDTGQARMIFKDFNIIGPDSVTASHGAHCATEQGRFWEFHDTVYGRWDGENTGWASRANLELMAADAGLDVPRWSECVDAGRYAGIIVASNHDARSVLKLGGTPAFFVIGPGGTTQISGAQPIEAFERAMAGQLGADAAG
ncbi:MAG: DsbA family protein [Nitrosopumilus sp.]|nr:DsbA family protein [Nitrosopumilus sp.]MDA7943636.1 DsbA family protein [Nitrosopumilus sp.]MDA7999317.1 DsbA family protein [Nitrosopumilus sp.]